STRSLAKHADAGHVQVAPRVQVIENHLDIVHGGCDRLWKLTNKPLPGRPVFGTLSSEGRNKAHPRSPTSHDALAIAIVFEAFCVAREAVEIEDHRRRFLRRDRPNDIQVDGIIRSPLYPDQLPYKCLSLSSSSHKGWIGPQVAALQGERRQALSRS